MADIAETTLTTRCGSRAPLFGHIVGALLEKEKNVETELITSSYLTGAWTVRLEDAVGISVHGDRPVIKWFRKVGSLASRSPRLCIAPKEISQINNLFTTSTQSAASIGEL